MTSERDAYRTTFFDRHGPVAASYVTSGVWGLAIGCVTFAIANHHGLTLGGIVASVAAALFTGTLGPTLGHVAGSIWNTIAVNGGSTPSQPQYSYQQTLVMQGRIDHALESFEEIIAADSGAIQPRIRAAELYLREGNKFRRAFELLREAQTIRPISAGEDIYIAHRLVDLFTGPLNTPGKALRELRRVIDQYGNSAAADQARVALAKLKERYVESVH